MSISIKGIRVPRVDIMKDNETGRDKIEGSYELMSNTDIVLAKQSFNGYNDFKVNMSPDTEKALNVFRSGLKSDIEKQLGVTDEN